jgi:hypothetical protein
LKTIIIVLDEYCFYNEHNTFKPLCLTLDANYANPLVTLVDAPLLLDEGFGLEEVSLTTLFELGTKAKC